MTTPNYLDHIPDSVVELFHEVHLAIIRDAARRIGAMKDVTSATKYQTYRAQTIGAYYDHIINELAKGTGMSRDTLADLFNDAGAKTLRSDDAIHRLAGKNPIPLADSPELQNILLAGLEQTLGTFRNLTRSAAYFGSEQLGQVLDTAWLKVTSGSFSYDAAIKEGIIQLSKAGVTAVRYQRKDGRFITNNIDVVVRRSVLSGVNGTACALQMARIQEMDTEFVETTAHAGARDTHAIWQGRIFQLVGNSLFPNFYVVTEYGTVTGLGGANCRHGFYPYYPGVSRPANTELYLEQLNSATVMLNGQEVKLADAIKEQRRHEREIREWKRIIAGLEEKGFDVSEETKELRKAQATLRQLIDETGLRRDYTRERAGKQYAA